MSFSNMASDAKRGDWNGCIVSALAGLLFVALLVSGCGQKKTESSEKTEPSNKGACECLTTPSGVPRKVIVKAENAKAYKDPGFTGESKDLDFFRKYFVYKEQKGGYLVGKAMTMDSTVGWVRREDVIPWNHEQAVFFINEGAGRAPVRLWSSRHDVGKADAPYFQENLSASETTEPFPILQREGSTVRVAFLWGKQGSTTALSVAGLDVGTGKTVDAPNINRMSRGGDLNEGGDKALARLQTGLRRLDIALVIDVTSSMGPYMEVVKRRMTEIVDQLSGLSKSFPVEPHIAVVAYRDYADSDATLAARHREKPTFTTKLLAFTQNRQRFDDFMAELTPHSIGVDKYEAVFEGLGDAVDRLDWGPSSYKLMFLVGDAPPQGFTPQAVAEPGVQYDSPYFTGTFGENAAAIQRKVADNGIRFFALQVGNDPETADAWRQILGSRNTGFRSLADASTFIGQLERELRAETANHAEAGRRASQAIDSFRRDGALSDADFSAINDVFNLPPSQLEELRKSRIQTGWFDIDAVRNRISVCVYLRRRDLEATQMSLQLEVKDGLVNAEELEVLKSILEPHLGKEALRDVRSVNDLMRRVKDLPLPPEVLREIAGRFDDKQMTDNLRTKINNLGILLAQRGLFNTNEEGWVPIEYLPGSMSKEH